MDLRELGRTNDAYLTLARRTARYSWVVDGVTEKERSALHSIGDTAKIDLETATLIANASWVADSLTEDEFQGIINIQLIAELDPQVARLVFDQPFMAPPFRHRDALALRGLYWLTYFGSESKSDHMAMVARQPWFEDGVDDMEAALLYALRFWNNEYMPTLVESHYIASARIHLPLAGDVDLVAIRNTPFPPDDTTLVAMEEGIRAIEEFMGTPFPTNDVMLLVVDPDIWRRAAGSVVGGTRPGFDSRMVLVNDRKAFAGEDRYKGVIYHELGHLHYSVSAPRWLGEGERSSLEHTPGIK